MTADAAPQRLRVSLIWRDDVLQDHVLDAPRAVTVGDRGTPTFVTPDLGLPAEFAIIRPGNRGYLLTLSSQMRGVFNSDGQRREVDEFVQRGGEGDVAGGFRATPIGPGDWGVVDLDASGDYQLFFQFVDADPPKVLATGRWTFPVFIAALVVGVLAGAATTAYMNIERDLSLSNALSLGVLAFLGGGLAVLGMRWLLAQDGELQAAAAFSAILFLGLIFLIREFTVKDDDPFVWPGSRALTGDYIAARLDMPVVEPEPEPEPIKGPATAAPEAAKASGQKENVKSATKNNQGKSGGEGEIRAKDPNAIDDVPNPPKVAFFEDRNKKYLDIVAKPNNQTSLNKFLAIPGQKQDGQAGAGKGSGTGVGDDLLGSGTHRGSKGNGTGGGGSAEGDFVSQGKIDTGETRTPKGDGKGNGSGVKEVAVVGIGTASGDFGGLSKEEIDKVVKARQGLIKACYQRELNRAQGLGGKLVVNFVIAADGTVKSTRVDGGKSSLRNAAVESCVRMQISKLKFPAKGGGVVNYPFIFSQG